MNGRLGAEESWEAAQATHANAQIVGIASRTGREAPDVRA